MAFSRSQVVGEQPQLLANPPPPQVFGDTHAPQCRVPPQPSGASPQVKFKLAQVLATH